MGQFMVRLGTLRHSCLLEAIVPFLRLQSQPDPAGRDERDSMGTSVRSQIR